MKLLVLLSRIPYPLEKGDKLRAYHQIRELSKYHDIVLCCLNESKIHDEARKKLNRYCSSVEIINLSKPLIFINLFLKLIFSRSSLQVAYFFSRRAKKKINGIIRKHKPDHIYCQLIRVTEYVKDQPIPKTLDYMDALARGMERRIENAPFYLRPFFKIESIRLKRYEHYIFDYFDNKTIISDQDRKLIVNAYNDQIKVIPNGVDFDKFQYKALNKDFELVFSGNMSYAPNINGAVYLSTKIMPIVWKKRPGTKLVIAGANPARKIKQLESKKVIVTGWVKDISEYYNRSSVFIAPMQIGTGLQNKLLEAMAHRLPCITSSLANNALGAKENEEVLIGTEPEDYAKHILKLLEDDDFSGKIGNQGYAFVKEHFSWKKSTAELNRMIINTAR